MKFELHGRNKRIIVVVAVLSIIVVTFAGVRSYKANASQQAFIQTEQEIRAKVDLEAQVKANQEAKAKVDQEAEAKVNIEAKVKTDQEAKAKAYGYSGNHTPLQVVRISNPSPRKKILCVFAIHGFEDAFYRDGQALVDTADGVIDYFKNDSASLDSYELIVVPCANPDGLKEGLTCNGPGRCQISRGIDINMDFAYNFRPRSNPRNKTGEVPFSSPEAAALRDLIVAEKPDLIIDFHGWIDCAAGDKEVAEVFCSNLGLSYDEKGIYDGFFSGWAAKYAKSVLVEYPNPFDGKSSFEGKSDQRYDHVRAGFRDFGYTPKTIKAIQEIVRKKL